MKFLSISALSLYLIAYVISLLYLVERIQGNDDEDIMDSYEYYYNDYDYGKDEENENLLKKIPPLPVDPVKVGIEALPGVAPTSNSDSDAGTESPVSLVPTPSARKPSSLAIQEVRAQFEKMRLDREKERKRREDDKLALINERVHHIILIHLAPLSL